MNKHIAGLCHVALWAFLFLSPLTFWRGTGIKFVQYLMYCMQPLMLMLVFYLNYLYLAPKYFVAGKHRYDLLINLVLVIVLGISNHAWMEFTNELFGVRQRYDDVLGDFANALRDSVNLAIFAGGSTALALARKWVTADQMLKESEAARAKAELSNLRSQINPHFLLNTLNNIYALTAINQERAQDAIQQLSKMMRHILYDNQDSEVPLRGEIQFLENYVNLMKIRLADNVDVRFNTSVQKPEVQIAPLLFISLVENAFKHGISPTNPSFIHIDIKTDVERVGNHDIRDVVICSISNSNYPKTQQDRSGHGIGLSQLQRRLDIAYPNRYEWEKGVSADGETYLSTIKIKL